MLLLANSGTNSFAGAIGAGISTNKIGQGRGHSVKSYIDSSGVTAGGNVSVTAVSLAEIEAISMGGSFSLAAGKQLTVGLSGAGAGSYNTINQDIESSIKKTSLNLF